MTVTLKENGAALGRGFVNFITGDIGQKIVLKSGIVPAKAITRVVETRNKL
jgi:phosphate transport system substrate-binding protein